VTTTDGKITRDDLEASFKAVAEGVDGKIEVLRPKIVTVALVAVGTIAVVSFLIGRKGGRKKSALIEIRRV
jgi:hypothetical protein